MKWVKLAKYCELSGDTTDAVHARRRRKVWIDGREVRKAPDSTIWINMEEIEKWVEQQDHLNCQEV